MSDYRQELIDLANRYCELTGKALATVSMFVVNDGKFFDRLQKGGGCTMDTYQKVMRWFEENLPVETPPRRKRAIKLIKK